MMYPEHMERIVLVAPTEHLKTTIEILYKHSVLHIIEHRKGEIDIGSPLASSNQLADLLVRVRSMLQNLDVAKDTAPAALHGDLGVQVTKVHEQVTELLSEQKAREDELSHLRTERAAYGQLAWLHVNPTVLRDSKHLHYFFGTVKYTEGLREKIEAITPQYYFEHQHDGNGVLLLIETEKAGDAAKVLEEHGFVAADHQRIVGLTKPLDKHLHELDQKTHYVQRQLNELGAEKKALRDQHAAFLVAAESVLGAEAKKAQAPLRFAVTKNSFLVNGWVPTKQYGPLKSDLEKQLKDEVFVDRVESHEEAPVKLDNSFVVSPFETLLRLYTLPKYHEIDPSTFLFFSFPIFFGFMLGDIGYGIVLLALFMLLRSTSKNIEVRSMSSILIMSAVATVIFGIVFGEFFGYEHIGSIELHPMLHRTHDMIQLLYVAVAVGVLHITAAYIIGFINELHHHGAWKAFCAKLSWILLLAGVAILALGKMGGNNALYYGGIATAVISVILIYIGEGMKGLIELPGILSNIMSYARLMALGVASAALAIVINEMAGGLFASHSVAGIIGGVLLLIVGHAINFALGIMGPFLHSLRLHYVEFFSKFYEGGGKPYKPFGVDEQ